MNTLLYITASLFGEAGQSSRLGADLVDAIVAARPGTRVLRRDLAADPVPHLDGARFAAFTTAPAERDAGQRAAVALSDALIAEWRAADRVVIGLPLYNLGVPSTFKAYIDHLARAGETFRYTAEGPVGLLQDRKVQVVATRGGIYRGTPLDTQSDYVRHILGLMGIRDVEFIHVEGLNMGPEVAGDALRDARATIQQQAA
ncbi:MAG: FMN-dependent NADH-azoreductase [Porticoccaceae bacterium]|jgi:FMN-dependent NADH-azoreductase|nr:FMN-dependent NADH-azoreductase [Porticoccaceae bacterium]MEA3298725.1 FMN-dependent NADH-azoreductase [Pseudomonadota bacterium]HLS97365.1 FMN-dependent NADH-azoreductase [Porticoccaceae bacterium]